MSVNSVGPNVGSSSLLASYLEKQAASPTQQPAPVQNIVQSPVQNAASFPQAPLRTFSEQTLSPQSQVVQAPQVSVAGPVVQNPVVQAPNAAPVVQAENDSKKPADNNEKPANEAKKPSFISRAKELFKNPKTKKIIFAGIGAAIVIAGITVFALCARKKPEVSPQLESALWNFVNTVNDFCGRGK